MVHGKTPGFRSKKKLAWTRSELNDLIRQVDQGKTANEMTLASRTFSSLRYKLRDIQRNLGKCVKEEKPDWTEKEMAALVKQAKQGLPPWRANIPGRSALAIRSKMIREKLWKPRKRVTRPWKPEEVEELKGLHFDLKLNAFQMKKQRFFPRRSYYSVFKKLQRL